MPDMGFLVCETIEPELTAVVRREGWDTVQVFPLEGDCLSGGSRCGKAGPRPLAGIPRGLDLHHIAYSCSPRLGASVTRHDHIGHRPLNSGFQLFLPGTMAEDRMAEGAYMVTSGWVMDWEERLARQKLSRDLAREMFREFARRVLLVDTGIHGEALARSREFSDCLGLPLDVVHSGLDLASLYLRSIVQKSRIRALGEEIRRVRLEVQGERAKRHLLLDLQRELSGSGDEETVLRRIHDLHSSLFAPENLLVLSLMEGRVLHTHPQNPREEDKTALLEFLRDPSRGGHTSTRDGSGFMVRFRRGDGVNGGVRMSNFTFPEHRGDYLDSSLALAPVCELVIARARALTGILPVCGFCHKIRDPEGDWHRFEAFISTHSDALFSHSVCPTCFGEHYPGIPGKTPASPVSWKRGR